MRRSERAIEAQTAELLLRHGWYDLKTDAAQTTRKKSTGSIPLGFPDCVFFLSIPNSALTLATLVEMKTKTGKLRSSQIACHAELRQLYQLPVHVICTPEEALVLIEEGRRLTARLKERP